MVITFPSSPQISGSLDASLEIGGRDVCYKTCLRLVSGHPGRVSRLSARNGGGAFPFNITVNAIAPGLTISMDEVDAARDTQNQQRLQARSIKRTVLPQDVVGAAVFLCAAESDFITGQTLVVDGGAQMH